MVENVGVHQSNNSYPPSLIIQTFRSTHLFPSLFHSIFFFSFFRSLFIKGMIDYVTFEMFFFPHHQFDYILSMNEKQGPTKRMRIIIFGIQKSGRKLSGLLGWGKTRNGFERRRVG